MTHERLTQAHNARPFQPFRIHLADGRTLEVPHPECLAYAPQGRTFIVVKADESFEIIDLLLVTSLEMRAASPPRSKSKK
ncbi:MAG: hypothetical protein SFV23_22205 [Planctomycetaceae bacterium]|nr:hypothetical protein [Planctomycetaceae bacterium]